MYKALTILLSIFVSTSSLGEEPLNSSAESLELVHLSSSWNREVLEKDLELMKELLSDGAQVSSAGMQLKGEDEVIQKFEFIFKRRPDLAWVNTPLERVEFESRNTAYEYGEWQEPWTQEDGKT